jgi:hypothetical protein
MLFLKLLWCDGKNCKKRPCIYCIYIFNMFNMENINIFYIMTNDLLLQTMTQTKDRPLLSSERAPHNNKPPRWGLDTKTDWLTVSSNVTLTLTWHTHNKRHILPAVVLNFFFGFLKEASGLLQLTYMEIQRVTTSVYIKLIIKNFFEFLYVVTQTWRL